MLASCRPCARCPRSRHSSGCRASFCPCAGGACCIARSAVAARCRRLVLPLGVAAWCRLLVSPLGVHPGGGPPASAVRAASFARSVVSKPGQAPHSRRLSAGCLKPDAPLLARVVFVLKPDAPLLVRVLLVVKPLAPLSVRNGRFCALFAGSGVVGFACGPGGAGGGVVGFACGPGGAVSGVAGFVCGLGGAVSGAVGFACGLGGAGGGVVGCVRSETGSASVGEGFARCETVGTIVGEKRPFLCTFRRQWCRGFRVRAGRGWQWCRGFRVRVGRGCQWCCGFRVWVGRGCQWCRGFRLPVASSRKGQLECDAYI